MHGSTAELFIMQIISDEMIHALKTESMFCRICCRDTHDRELDLPHNKNHFSSLRYTTRQDGTEFTGKIS
jgi:hypothetical protein